MTFVLRSLVIATLALLVGLTFNAALDLRCPSPRFEHIGHTGDGLSIIVFDACLGFAYAAPVAGLNAIQKQKGWDING